jgi:hypothetical protein
MSEMSAFQRKFLNRAEAVDLFTQEEFDKELEIAKQEILQMAIVITANSVSIEREICATIAEKFDPAAADAIRKHRGNITLLEMPDAKD